MGRTFRVPALPPPDPGLQPERTVLAWTRTLLALVVCALLFVRWLPIVGWPSLLPFAISLVGGVWIYLGRRRTSYRSVLAIQLERQRPPVAAVMGLSALVMLVAASALLVI